MIVTTDIGNILYRDCKAFGISIVPNGETLTGELKSEVNLCVPDLSKNEANSIRLNELERQAMKILRSTGSYNGSFYRYSIYNIGTEADTALKCHYVNVSVLFEVLNVK